MEGKEPAQLRPGLLATWFWPAVLALTLLVIVLVTQWLLSLELNAGFWELLRLQWVAAAILVQGLSMALAVLNWKWVLELNGAEGITFRHALAMLGLNAIGKYAPGKVVGVLARGAWLVRRNGGAGLAVRSTLVEQAAMFHVGAALALFAWLMKEAQVPVAALLAVLALLSVPLLSRWGGSLVSWASQRLGRGAVDPDNLVDAFARSYCAACCSMLAIWVATVLVLYCCILSFGQVIQLDVWWLTWVVSLAYLGGFAAFFLPAGIGAREGVMVVMLGTQMDLGVAVYVALLHRLVTLVVDCLLGAAALAREPIAPQGVAWAGQVPDNKRETSQRG